MLIKVGQMFEKKDLQGMHHFCYQTLAKILCSDGLRTFYVFNKII
jgi:hypothetical protein